MRRRAEPGRARRPPVAGRESGFTLIEALIGLAIVSLIFAMIVGATGFSGQAMESADRRIEQTESLLLTYRVLRQMVGRAYQLPSADDNADRTISEGQPDKLHFLALLPNGAQIGGIYDVAFRLARGTDGDNELWLALMPVKPDSARGRSNRDPQEFLVYRGPRTLRFSYLLAGDTAASPEWRPSFDGKDGFPQLVKLSEDGGTPPWAPLIARPRIDPRAGCEQLGNTPACARLPRQ